MNKMQIQKLTDSELCRLSDLCKLEMLKLKDRMNLYSEEMIRRINERNTNEVVYQRQQLLKRKLELYRILKTPVMCLSGEFDHDIALIELDRINKLLNETENASKYHKLLVKLIVGRRDKTLLFADEVELMSELDDVWHSLTSKEQEGFDDPDREKSYCGYKNV